MLDDQQSSRRSFVVGGLATVAGLNVAGCGGGSGSGTVAVTAPPVASLPPLTTREVGDWEGLVGTSFRIAGERGEVSAVLTALERGGADANRPATLARSQPFVAFFEIVAGATVPVGNQAYRVLHATKGSFDLFLGQPAKAGGKDVMLAILN